MKRIIPLIVVVTVFGVVSPGFAADQKKTEEPRVVTPGKKGSPPSDAIVLFDGTDLSAWEGQGGKTPTWKVEDGAIVVGKGGITSKQD